MTAMTKTELIERYEQAKINAREFYSQPIVNYRGKTLDGEKYTELIAEKILADSSFLTELVALPRVKSYWIPKHQEKDVYQRKERSNRREEQIAYGMMGKEYAAIGKVVEFQMPLKQVRTDKLGKVDLVSFKDGTLYLLELKRPESKETLLRSVLEIFTYSKTVCETQLYKDFFDGGKINATKVNKGILIFKDSPAYEEYVGDAHQVRQLMKGLDAKCFVMTENPAGEYAVEECHL